MGKEGDVMRKTVYRMFFKTLYLSIYFKLNCYLKILKLSHSTIIIYEQLEHKYY